MTAPANAAAIRGLNVVAVIVAIVSLWPLAAHLPAFRSLLYFQDEWDLIDLWDKIGFGSWLTTTFAENFVPLFKLSWSGVIVASGGSYLALLIVLWLNHALNVFLLVRLAGRFSGGLAGGALAGLAFGLAWVNYETLTWCLQWSAVLSLSFFLFGVDFAARWDENGAPAGWRAGLVLGACTLASALCFSRGVLSGGALAAWALLTPRFARSLPDRVIAAALTLMPAMLVAWWIFGHSTGNHQHVAEALRPMLDFALYYYAQSPLRALWSNDTPGPAMIIFLFIVKSAVFVIGLALAPARLRAALATLWIFEIGNALLLGLGRYHTGLPASGGSRYQYGALAALLPFVAVLWTRALSLLPIRLCVRSVAATVGLTALAFNVASPWRDTLKAWIPGRGQELRRHLFSTPPAAAPPNFVGLPWMSNERTRELAAKYHLH
jgi:hypothetical protein